MKTFQKAGVYIVWAVLTAGIMCVYFAPNVTPVQLTRPLRDLPFDMGGWAGRNKTASDYLAGTLGADDILLREYDGIRSEKAELYMSYFAFTQNKKSPHAPQLCWVGSGWALKDLGEEALSLDCEKCPVAVFRKVLAEKGGAQILLFYTYKINNRYVTDLLKFRLISAFDSITRRKNSAFTLQLSSRIDGHDLTLKEAQLKELLLKILTSAEKELLPQ